MTQESRFWSKDNRVPFEMPFSREQEQKVNNWLKNINWE